MLRIALTALILTSATAEAATVPAYRWTPAQASAQIVRWNPAAVPDALRPGQSENIKSAKCGGYGPARQGRYLAFRCVAVYQSLSVRGTPHAVTLWARVRQQGSGQPCVSTKSLAAIPYGCKRTVGARLPGSVSDAKQAVVERTAAVLGPTCIGYGAGYYMCSYQVGDDTGRAAVSFAPGKVSVTLL